jgi:hypothetical protein
VGFSGWGPTYQQPLLGLWHTRLHQYGVPLPTAAPIQRLAAPTTCQQLLHEAGFVEIAVQSEQLGYYLRTPEEWWAQMWASRNRMAVLALAPAQRAQFQADYLAEVRALATPQGIWIDVATNFAAAGSPQRRRRTGAGRRLGHLSRLTIVRTYRHAVLFHFNMRHAPANCPVSGPSGSTRRKRLASTISR